MEPTLQARAGRIVFDDVAEALELAAQGVAIMMISSELPEILGMSDRIAVMHGGTIVAKLDRAEATQQQILALALGHPECEGELTVGNAEYQI